MLPILAGLVVGSGASPRRGFALASSYVVCMALVYAALGVLAALLGANLAALLQTPWILGSFAALFVILALPMFGFFELQLPAFLRDRLDTVSRRQSGGSLVGAGVLGALSGLLVGPCAFLAPYPSRLLTPDPDIGARLVRFGLRRIGAIAELARSALIARFGEEGGRIHARARGEELEPFRPRRAPERLTLALPIEPADGEPRAASLRPSSSLPRHSRAS